MEKAFKYRIYPNKSQQELIQKTFGCVRFVYNYFLNERKRAYEENGHTMRFYECSKILTSLKQEKDWLKEPDKWALQNSLKDLETAYKKFFEEKKGRPKFKSRKNRYKSYRTTFANNNIEFLTNGIKLPKLGKVRMRDKRAPEGRILNATISQEPNGHYYVSFCCTDIDIKPLPKTNINIGIDLGLVDFATLSNGIKINNPKFYEQSERKLVKLQRELSRKSIGSSNRNKARIKVAKLQKHIAEQRRDFLQKLTTQIVRDYDVICIEDLDVRSMKETDSSVRNKRIGDVSFYEFRRQLEYKCRWYNKELVIINKYFPSSRLCHVCNHNGGKKDVSVRKWICINCNTELDRDLNAAINILNEGLRVYNKPSP